MSYRNYFDEERARETPNQRENREQKEKASLRKTDMEWMRAYITALEERIKNPSDRGFSPFTPKKATNITLAKTELGFNAEQVKVIEETVKLRNLLMEDSIIENYDEMKASILKLSRDGKQAFPMGGNFQRIARFFHGNKDKKGSSIVLGTPMWFIQATMPREGGKRRTHKHKSHKRSTRKRSTRKRSTRKRSTHKRRN